MTKLDDDRRMRLRGSYLDRIIESAQHYAATHTYFVDREFESYIADEFKYLTELSEEEQQYLRDQVAVESLRRVAKSRAKYREEIFGQLIADNPDVVVHDGDFAFDIGWIDLIKGAVERVRTYPESWKVRLDGGKEKFGCLVLHIACDYDQLGCRSEVERLREEIRLRSLGMCEVCGEQGRLRLGHWAKTVCDRHAAVLGEFREDDGVWADPWRWHEEQPLEDHIADVIAKGSALMASHATTAVARQIEADLEKNFGRKAELLLEFRDQIEIAVVAAMSVADADVDFWLRTEVGRWQGVQPVTDDDREFLVRYLRSLAIDELRRCMPSEDVKSDND